MPYISISIILLVLRTSTVYVLAKCAAKTGKQILLFIKLLFMKLFLLPHVYTLLLQRFRHQTLVTLLFTVNIGKPELPGAKFVNAPT